MKDFVKMSCTHYDTNHITWAKAWENQVWGLKSEINGIKIHKVIDK